MALQKYIVSKDDSIYEAWPDIALTKSGNLIHAYSPSASTTATGIMQNCILPQP